jgi:hypothetical protein
MRSRALKTIFVFPAALAVQDTPAGLIMVRSGRYRHSGWNRRRSGE